jgi:hypothetical protein
MVSLSTNEMIRQMVENYGFGAYLFHLVNLEELQIIQKLYPSFDVYLDDLFSGKIYDPASKEILEDKYKNSRWIHPPKEYQFKITSDLWKKVQDKLEKDDSITRLQILLDREINLAVGISPMPEIDSDPIADFRKGDVLHVSGANIEAYYILDDVFQNVYLKYDDIILTDFIIGNFNMLLDTPANFWNELNIPELKFYFDFPEIFENVKWIKIEQKGQNYLLGEFNYYKTKQKLYIPLSNIKGIGLEEKISQRADKLAVSLQIQKVNVFSTRDPNGIIPDGPNVFFAPRTNDVYVVEVLEDTENDEKYDS